MINNLTEKNIADFKEAFTMFDRDNDGKISYKEMEIIMRNFGQNNNDETVEEIFEANTNNDNITIEFPQFLDMMAQNMQTNGTEDELRNAFKSFDNDNTELISAKELRYIMTNLGEKLISEDVDEMIREANVDEDGNINYNNFVNMIFAK